MRDTFRTGEVVVCVDASRRWYRLGGLRQNEKYTVVGFNHHDGGLILDEIKCPRSGCHAYSSDRFRKAKPNFTGRNLPENE